MFVRLLRCTDATDSGSRAAGRRKAREVPTTTRHPARPPPRPAQLQQTKNHARGSCTHSSRLIFHTPYIPCAPLALPPSFPFSPTLPKIGGHHQPCQMTMRRWKGRRELPTNNKFVGTRKNMGKNENIQTHQMTN